MEVGDTIFGLVGNPERLPSQAKDAFYELEVAAALKLTGVEVALAEPDIVASGAGLAKPLAIACKYPSSRQRLQRHVSEGYGQIAKHGLDGVVCIGLDLVLGIEAGLDGLIDFRLVGNPPFEVQRQNLQNETERLSDERRRDYPSERALDGLVTSVFIAGFYLKPLRYQRYESYAVGSREGSSLEQDLDLLVGRLNARAGRA